MGNMSGKQNEANLMHILYCYLCSLPLNKWSRAFLTSIAQLRPLLSSPHQKQNSLPPAARVLQPRRKRRKNQRNQHLPPVGRRHLPKLVLLQRGRYVDSAQTSVCDIAMQADSTTCRYMYSTTCHHLPSPPLLFVLFFPSSLLLIFHTDPFSPCLFSLPPPPSSLVVRKVVPQQLRKLTVPHWLWFRMAKNSA